jgi:lipopolysaccharide biosynthesis glycosyltransferase
VDEARQGIFDNAKDPYIVHYTSQLKPWNSRISYELSEYFWKYACKSVFYEEIIEKKIFLQMWERYSFPYDRVKPYSNVIIYGYGMVGKSIFSQMRWSGYCNIVAICDKSVTEIDEIYSIGGATPPIIKIRDIPKYQYDYIVIALESEETAQNVKKDLMEHGVSEDKIVWECPIRKSV